MSRKLQDLRFTIKRIVLIQKLERLLTTSCWYQTNDSYDEYSNDMCWWATADNSTFGTFAALLENKWS